MKQIIIFNHKSYMLADDVLEYINDNEFYRGD